MTYHSFCRNRSSTLDSTEFCQGWLAQPTIRSMAVPIVALYGSLNAIFNIILALRVSQGRLAEKVPVGDGGAKSALFLRSRIHGNNAEYVPLGIVMLLVAELSGGQSAVLHSLGGALLVSRIFHAFGMTRPAPNFFRATGIGVTWAMIVATAGYTLFLRGI